MDNANELNQQQDTSQAQNQNETVQVQQQNPAQADSESLRSIALDLKHISEHTKSMSEDIRTFRFVLITLPAIMTFITLAIALVLIILYIKYGNNLL